MACCNKSIAQDLIFNRVLRGDNNTDFVLSIAQDKYGFIWMSRQLGGLQRYDGREIKSFQNDPANPNSPASNYIESFIIDADNIFWLGTINRGLDRFDPATNTFTHYRHNEKDKSSLINDKINTLYADKAGNIWIGTDGGLEMLDKKTGKFTHYVHDQNDKTSLSYNEVRAVYEDRAGTIWVGCGHPFVTPGQNPEDGGLNRLDKATGKFTRYMHEAGNLLSLSDCRVRAIYEDSKGNFWIGTRGDGLHLMDREKGIFKNFRYDPKHPGKLSRPPQYFAQGLVLDHISFITEDQTGNLLIGAFKQGINYFNPADSTLKHYGTIYNGDGNLIRCDSATGLSSSELFKVFHAREGILWIGTLNGDLYTAQPQRSSFPYYMLNAKMPDANALYCEPGGKILWIGTDQGLFRRDLQTGAIKTWIHDPHNKESLCHDTIVSIKADDKGRLWMATFGGLTRFDPVNNTFKTWKHDPKNKSGIHSNALNEVFIDKEKTVWIGFVDAGVDKMDAQTETFTNFKSDLNNFSKTLCDNYVYQICEDRSGYVWIATENGLDKIRKIDGIITHYLPNQSWRTVMMDAKGIVWTASIWTSAFFFDSANNNFQSFRDAGLKKEISKVINIIEDKQGNLWLTQEKAIVKLDKDRQNIKVYGASSGIHVNEFGNSSNYISEKGELFLGDQSGYYHFSPASLKDIEQNPSVTFTAFSIDEKEVVPGEKQPLNKPVSDVQEINLEYNQNTFSFDFFGINYLVAGEMKYAFKLENYDKEWHNAGTEHKAYFYNIPPGTYILRVKAISQDGATGEQMMTIKITPPWWRTWWAYSLFGIAIAGLIGAVINYRSRQLRLQNRSLENKVTERTKELQDEKEKVEIALTELKSAQAQLIQSEKMASLGQLTAGIAHEIQNPLNFVNNFSDISNEMVAEMKQEMSSGNLQEAKAIADDISQNLEKINHHGKRAESIVKGMLQHSRTSSGQKELIDINALADEYLKLAYHGVRAKDKSFNVTMQTDFDNSIGKINIVPQDIGRVLLNIYNNAFYAMAKRKTNNEKYEPVLTVNTSKINSSSGDKSSEITITNNGPAIPQEIVEKIFQPFFTTKPTGEGTGLGLSLAYDIVKAHGGELKVKTENGLTSFVIVLPA